MDSDIKHCEEGLITDMWEDLAPFRICFPTAFNSQILHVWKGRIANKVVKAKTFECVEVMQFGGRVFKKGRVEVSDGVKGQRVQRAKMFNKTVDT